MKAEISALLDGEVEQHQLRMLFKALGTEGELRDTWSEYQLIGDAMRGELWLETDIGGRVMQSLEDEPVVLAPKRHNSDSWQRPLMAVAASVAGVALVVWLALPAQILPQEQPEIAQVQLPSVKPVAVVVAPVAGNDLQEYVLAHQAHAPGLSMLGATQHIRTVSVAADR